MEDTKTIRILIVTGNRLVERSYPISRRGLDKGSGFMMVGAKGQPSQQLKH